MSVNSYDEAIGTGGCPNLNSLQMLKNEESLKLKQSNTEYEQISSSDVVTLITQSYIIIYNVTIWFHNNM